jgi:hypothetical protein
MKLTKKTLLAGLVTAGLSLAMVLPLVVGATSPTAGDLGVPTIDDLDTTLGDASLTEIIQSGLTIFFSLLGIIAVLVILYAGFTWMTAQGEPDKVEKAKKMLYSGITGLIIIFLALAISNFVTNALKQVTGVAE